MTKSRPHGRADRNPAGGTDTEILRRRALTGARIETLDVPVILALVESRPHGRADRNGVPAAKQTIPCVAPSRARGSKPRYWRYPQARSVAPSRARGSKHPAQEPRPQAGDVAPSRARGSKLCQHRVQIPAPESRPHGRADRNAQPAFADLAGLSRALTGARIETSFQREHVSSARSRPHGRADRNLRANWRARRRPGRALTGARIGTIRKKGEVLPICGRALTGARIETFAVSWWIWPKRVAPSRARGSKRSLRTTVPPSPRRALTGARIETNEV